jgi:hypothetical protein
MYKRHYLILIGLLFVQVASLYAQLAYNDISFAQHDSIFIESYENNSNNWITDNSWISGKFSNGCYDIVCKNFNQNTGLTYKTITIDQTKDFEIETSFKVIKGNGALVFGLTKNFDHYRVEIDNKKSLIIAKDTPIKSKIDRLFSGSVKSIKDTGFFNKVSIIKIKDIYYVFINDLLVKQFNKLILTGDQIGYSVGLNSEISVDYLKISYLTIKAAPLVAERNISQKDSVKPTPENISSVIPLQKDSSSLLPPNTSYTSKTPAAPSINWVSPSGLVTTLDSYTVRIRASIKSGSDLKSVSFYVNGISRGEGEIKPLLDETGTFLAEKTINLNPGQNNVYFIATNPEGSTKSDLRYFTNPLANPPDIKWGVPTSSNEIVSSEIFTLEVCIKSPADLISAKVLVDGVQVNVGRVFQRSVVEGCNYIWKPQIILKDGDNSLYVIAENIAGSTTSENRIIRYSKTIAEKRLALIFGNSDYITGNSLKNPVNDANLIEATLKELGFEVIKRTNSGRDSMMSSIREFSKKLTNYNVALFYYAGHGIQVDGVNYLIPTNAKLENKDDCKWEAIEVTTVTDEFKKHSANTNIVILDACRNNPYRAWARGGEQGFKALAPINGTIISFSTSEGATAADGEGANGLFTEELVKQMVIPQQIESVFKKTRKEVVERSRGQQIPTEWSYLTGDFYFKR